jgi:DNA-binding SARP family transcriptional activator
MTADPTEFAFRLKTLGPFPRLVRIGVGGEESLVFGPGKPLAMLIYLSMAPGRTASRGHLTDLLWADSDLERARQSLRQALWQIRRKLGDDALVNHGEEVTLATALPADHVAVGAALRAARFEEAVQRYEGDFLGEFGVPGGAGFEHWADMVRARLRSGWIRALDALARERLNRGAMREAVALARRLRDADAGNEAVWRLLLDTLLLAGDPLGAGVEADALEAKLAEERREPEAQTIPFLARVRAMPPPAAAFARSTLTAELIGREGEFRRITQAWERARAGEGRHIHLSAPAGLGKTRLLRDAERRLRAMGGRILYLRAPPGSRQIAYAFAAELARALIVLPGASGVSPAVLSTLLALDPSLATGYRGAPDPSEGTEALRRRTLALADLVLALGEEAPLALLLDDMHWMDRESLQVLTGLVSRLTKSATLVVTAGRPIAVLGPAEAETEVLALAPLTESQVEALVMSLGAVPEADWPRMLVRRLHEASGGSPHLILESLQLALDGGWLVLDVHGWTCRDAARIAAELPAGDAMRRRVEGLDAPSRVLLSLLAVAAAPLRGEILAGAAGRPEADVTALVSSLELRGFVALAEDHWRLGHDELADVALRGLDAGTVRDLARRLGIALVVEPSISSFDQQRAAELLIQGEAEDMLVPLFRRWLASAHRLRDPRTDLELARALLGSAATPDRLRRALRARPMHRRLGLVSGVRTWGVAGAGSLMLGALALLVNRNSTSPSRMALLQAPVAGNGSVVVPVPVIEIQDRSGRRVRNADVSVRVEMVGHSRGVLGSTTVAARDGLATFDRIGLEMGSDAVLRFSAGALPPVSVRLHDSEAAALWLDHAELNGQTLDPDHRVLTIRPGEPIHGIVTLRYSAYWAAASVILGAVPTWGDKRRNFQTVSALATPIVNGVSPQSVSLAGPEAPGDYHLVLAFAAEPDAGWIASGTNWKVGHPIWDDGNDLADLSEAGVAEANAQGRVRREWVYEPGRRKTMGPATTIEVRVR